MGIECVDKTINGHSVYPCPWCGYYDLYVDNICKKFFVGCAACGARGPMADTIEEAIEKWNEQVDEEVVIAAAKERIMREQEREEKTDYPQDSEENEYRYISPAWLDEIARGLTKGAVKHPGETWKTIPCDEHLARALRHINLYRMGDRKEPHLVNASMRLMMAFFTEATEIDREAWEKLMREKGCG